MHSCDRRGVGVNHESLGIASVDGTRTKHVYGAFRRFYEAMPFTALQPPVSTPLDDIDRPCATDRRATIPT